MNVFDWSDSQRPNPARAMNVSNVFACTMTPAQAIAAADKTIDGYQYNAEIFVPGLGAHPGAKGLLFVDNGNVFPVFNWQKPLDEIEEMAHNEFSAAIPAYAAYFGRMAARGFLPDRIINDHEAQWTLWHLSNEQSKIGGVASTRIAPLYNEPRKLPAAMRGVSLAKYDRFWTHSDPDRADVEWAFNRWAVRSFCRAMRAAQFDVARAAFGQIIPTTNWADWFGSDAWRCISWNGVRINTGGIYIESSPILYLSAAVQYQANYEASQTGRDAKWQAIIQFVNQCRAVHARGGDCVPWISHSDYVADGYADSAAMRVWWRALILAVRPYCRDFLFWNVGADNAYASSVFAEAAALPRYNGIAYKVPMNAGAIKLRGYPTINYSDLYERT